MRNFGILVLTWAALMVGLSGGLRAENNPVVVELYTSQGCSSCPPADAFLQKLAARDDVIALGLHVDYWDYLGWKDELASPQFTKRQRTYARVAGKRSIYTPQMIIGGRYDVVGHKVMDVMDYVGKLRTRDTGISLDLTRQNGRVVISANARDRARMTVELIRYQPLVPVAIRRGENAGRTIDYSNTVTQWEQVQKWNGASPLTLSVNAPGTDPVVVLIQAEGQGEILAAAQLR